MLSIVVALRAILGVGRLPVSTSLHWSGTPLVYVETWVRKVTMWDVCVFRVQLMNCFTRAFKKLKKFSCACVVLDYLSRGGRAHTKMPTSSNEKDLWCLDCLKLIPLFNPILNFSSVLRILFSSSLQCWLSPAGHCRPGKIHMHVDVVVLVMVSMGSP